MSVFSDINYASVVLLQAFSVFYSIYKCIKCAHAANKWLIEGAGQQLQAVVYIRGEGGGGGGGGLSRRSPKRSCQDSPGQSFMEAENTSSAFTSSKRCIIASSNRQYSLRWRWQVARAAFSLFCFPCHTCNKSKATYEWISNTVARFCPPAFTKHGFKNVRQVFLPECLEEVLLKP